MLTLGDVLARSTAFLERKGVPSPRVDAEHLLGHALDLQRIELYMHLDRPLTDDEVTRARALVSRRGSREPLQYVLASWGFRRLTLTVDRRALIPRPETETLVERALALIAGCPSPRVLDVGTGSGAIALAIADEWPEAQVTGIDVSADALALAAENRRSLGLRVELVERDLRHGLLPGPWDLVVANPPYVRRDETPALAPEIRDWEPEAALFGEGLHELIAELALPELAPGGAVALEVGDGQAGPVARALFDTGYVEVEITPDLAGRDRVVEGRRG
ncbi:MAG: peptide chain release factor N(5)-glutamine methyltransferase [Actinobacteria bacterium]|nr:peptide chain release factor N(5)-glutamine methyltransferase [Actinomycetota bacterium]